MGTWLSGSPAIPVIIRERGRQRQEEMMMRHGTEGGEGVGRHTLRWTNIMKTANTNTCVVPLVRSASVAHALRS